MKRTLSILGLLLLAACVQTPGPDNGSSSASSVGEAASSVSPPSSTGAGVNRTDLPLSVPAGFTLETFAEDLTGARVIVKDGFGNLWVSRPSAGIVSHIDLQSGTSALISHPLRGLNRPHGMVIDDTTGFTLYVAEEDKIVRVHLYSDAPLEDVATLPAGGRHFTRMLGIGPDDDRLYVSIGSTCDVCVEEYKEHGTIISMNKDGTDRRIEAEGLRNAVFFNWHPATNDLWATDMGRDMIGDDIPPEEVNIVEADAHYGWPFCYGNRVRDMSFQPETMFDCTTTKPPHLVMQAHSAPLGLAFIPEEGWPQEYWHDLLVAQHGSWNRSTPVGYKIVRLPLDANGNPEGPPVDFISGFYANGAALGRPVDVHTETGGVLYISDDKNGAIYRLHRTEE